MSDSKLEKTFIELIQQNERIIYKVCSFYVSDEFPMTDLYQEVVYNLWKGFPKFRNDISVSTWMYRIALNTFKREKLIYTIILPIFLILLTLGMMSHDHHIESWRWAFVAAIFGFTIFGSYWQYKTIYDANIQSIAKSLEKLKELDEE